MKIAAATGRPSARYPLSFDRSSDLLGTSHVTPQPYEFDVTARDGLEDAYRALLREMDAGAPDGPAADALRSRLAAVCYQLGRIHYDLACAAAAAGGRAAADGERALAVSMFLRARDAVEDREAHADNVLSAINSLNMLGLIEGRDRGDHEEALQYLLEAEFVYQTHCEAAARRRRRRRRRSSRTSGQGQPPPPPPSSSPPPASSCTPARALLAGCPGPRRRASPVTAKNPLVCARLYSLFYAVEAYKNRGQIADALIRTHFALKLQVENDLFLQSPLDWALSCALIAQLFAEQNAYRQARHHLAAASTMLDKVVPREYGDLYESETYRQYSADISYCWARYGLRLLKKSKSRLVKRKTHRQAPVIFGNLLFKHFNISHEERVTQYYVSSYEDAQSLANHVLICLNRTKKYYTFEKVATYHACLCMDICDAYKLLSYFQDNPDKMGKLFKKGIVDLELTANRLNEENCLSVCRRIWYELGTVYSDMMDIKYERHVRNKTVLTERATKKINRYSNSSIKYYSRFIESFYVQRKLPERVSEFYEKPVLLAHLHIARCSNKKIVNQKDIKMDIILQCKQYYKAVMDYCKTNPSTEDLIPIELTSCKNLLLAIPSKIERLKKTKEPVKYFV